MKRFLCAMLALFVMLMAVSCVNVAFNGGVPGVGLGKEVSLYARGLDMVRKMVMLADNEDYVALYTASASIMDIVVDELGTQDYETPRAVFEIGGIGEAVTAQVIAETGGASFDEEITEQIHNRLANAMASQLNAYNGVEFLAASQSMIVSDCFVDSALDSQKTYIYLYDSDYAGMVSFTPYDGGAVHALGNIVKNDAFSDINTVEDMAAFLEEAMMLTGLDISMVDE